MQYVQSWLFNCDKNSDIKKSGTEEGIGVKYAFVNILKGGKENPFPIPGTIS